MIYEPPTQEEVDRAFHGVNIGPNRDPYEMVKLGILKCCTGYWNGQTVTTILSEFGLIKITKNKACEMKINVTEKGRQLCYDWHQRTNW